MLIVYVHLQAEDRAVVVTIQGWPVLIVPILTTERRYAIVSSPPRTRAVISSAGTGRLKK